MYIFIFWNHDIVMKIGLTSQSSDSVTQNLTW
jgi:hypothetical protein